MEAHKRNRNPEFKPKYQGINWAEYEKNLVLPSLSVVEVEVGVILLRASDLFEVVFVLHTCLFTSIHSNHKLSPMLSEEKL